VGSDSGDGEEGDEGGVDVQSGVAEGAYEGCVFGGVEWGVGTGGDDGE